MTEEFKKEIKQIEREVMSTHCRLTNYWMDGKFESETDTNIGITLDFLNKALQKLNAMLE